MSTIDAIERHSADVRDANSVSLPKLSYGKVTMLRRMVVWMGNAAVKHRTRIHLSELTNEQLKDIGVSPYEARQESKRLFWD